MRGVCGLQDVHLVNRRRRSLFQRFSTLFQKVVPYASSSLELPFLTPIIKKLVNEVKCSVRIVLLAFLCRPKGFRRAYRRSAAYSYQPLVEDYFSTFEFDQSIDRFFTWGTDLKSTLVARIIDVVFHRVILSSVYWEPIDDSYDGLITGCQYMEWDETCDDTIRRSLGQTREIFAENDSGDIQTYAFPNNVHTYMWARKLVADSSGSLMFIMSDENKLVLAKRDKFRDEWHPDEMFGNFKFTINPDFTKELKL